MENGLVENAWTQQMDSLKSSKRIDDRTPNDFSKVKIQAGNIGTAEGSAAVCLGRTMVTCGVKVKVATPSADSPDRGWLVANVELPPLCSRKFRPGPPSEEAQTLSQSLQDLLSSSIRLESLVIESGRAALCVYVDVVCTDHSGCLLDAALLAAVAALRNTRIPRLEYRREEDRVVVLPDEEKMSLQLSDCPIAITWIVNTDGRLLANPLAVEEERGGGMLSVISGEKEVILGLKKFGGPPVHADVVRDVLKKGLERGNSLRTLLDRVRDQGGAQRED